MANEGRIARGLRLVRQSLVFLRQRPGMLALPALSGVVITISGALFAAAAIGLDDGSGWGFAIAAALAAFPLTAMATFFNVAFLAMASDVVDGHEPTLRGGLRLAEERLGPILAWSFLATCVGLFLVALQQIPVVGEWLGRLLAFAGGLAWGLATFFVLPIITLHGTGARESVRRSATAFRSRWGEAVTSDIGISAVMMLVLFPAFVAIGVGVPVWAQSSHVVGGLLIVGGILAAGFAFTLSAALSSLVQLFLYRYVSLGTADGPFAVADLERAVRPKRRPFWRR
jgi:hypothetical protein